MPPHLRRSRATARALAADIRLDGILPKEFAVWAEWLQVGGTGRYGSFTHLDAGPI